jgi:hypothetical protein
MSDSETSLDKVLNWRGKGPKATLAGDANADIMRTIIKSMRERTMEKGTEKSAGIDGKFTGRNGGAHTKRRV